MVSQSKKTRPRVNFSDIVGADATIQPTESPVSTAEPDVDLEPEYPLSVQQLEEHLINLHRDYNLSRGKLRNRYIKNWMRDAREIFERVKFETKSPPP